LPLREPHPSISLQNKTNKSSRPAGYFFAARVKDGEQAGQLTEHVPVPVLVRIPGAHHGQPCHFELEVTKTSLLTAAEWPLYLKACFTKLVITQEAIMLVGERMSKPVISIPPDMPIIDALNLMRREHIRRTPVIKDGKLVGIVSDKDLLNASPSQATSLSVWEMNYLLSKITVKDVMTKDVLTVSENTPIEDAARIMADNKIGGLPVMRGSHVAGIITETDLFKLLLELMGARESGVRVTALVQEARGQLARLTQAIAAEGGNFIAIGQFAGDSSDNRLVTFKVTGLDEKRVREITEPLVERLVDIRLSYP
jgi:acetoin utilization protein AcuB